tara:strand:+ start:756 stop:1190 length:435 start_codon:yes stop_codon:yes gene_type:complete
MISPVTLKEARAWVNKHHRHHRSPQGGLFAIGLAESDEIIGVAIIGRPVARMLDNGYTAEVTRLAVLDNKPNACSMLYAAAWRAARAMGYRKMLTYILDTEPGTSVRAAGWKEVAKVKGQNWDRPSRPRVDLNPKQAKLRFEVQ